MESADLNDALSTDFSRFDNTGDLDLHNEIFPPDDDNLFIDGTEEDSEPDDIIILHMDIREPLSGLRALLEHKIGIDLNGFSFWLQDAQMLEPHKNLVDQCVKGEGLVQINVQIQTINQRINIVDVLKPTEADLAAFGEDVDTNIKKPETPKVDENEISEETVIEEENTNSNQLNTLHDEELKKPAKDISPVVNWVLDNKFKKDQIRLKIPEDPNDWTTGQVKHWLQWAVRQFNLTQIKLSDWNIDGKELCKLNLEDFKIKVPCDPGNVFWTHLELLRKCKFVAIIQKVVPPTPLNDCENLDDNNTIMRKSQKVIKKPMTLIKQYNINNSPISMPYQEFANRSGNNGQIQLWQFLLDILTDKEHTSIIQWLGDDGEFKLNDPEKVAQLWGERKNKPAMNYEKLSRALRYYYDGDMISKVNGKRFVYKFVCDLKQLIGYNAQELSNLVNSCDSNNSWTSIKL